MAGPGPTGIRTARLLLRRWREEDREPFAAMNTDPAVMEHFPAPMSRVESDFLVDYIERGFERDGFGLWALELPGEAPFIGFTGLLRVREDRPFAPAVEVGWRLAAPFWRRGLATEAARASLDAGFGVHGLREIVAYTYVGNMRSRAVMERLGMSRDPADDFEHPNVERGHRIARHVLYRVSANDFSH